MNTTKPKILLREVEVELTAARGEESLAESESEPSSLGVDPETPSTKSKYAKFALAAVAALALGVGIGVGFETGEDGSAQQSNSASAYAGGSTSGWGSGGGSYECDSGHGKSGKTKGGKYGERRYTFEKVDDDTCLDDKGDFYSGLIFVGFTGTIDQCLDHCDGLSTPRFRGVRAFELAAIADGDICGCLYDKDFVPPCPASGYASPWAGHLYSECRQGGPGTGSGPIANIADGDLGCYKATLAEGKSGKTGGDGGYYGGHSSKSSKGHGSATFTEVGDGICKGTSSSDNTVDSQYNSLQFAEFTGDLEDCQHKCAAIGGMGFRGIEFDDKSNECRCLYDAQMIPACPKPSMMMADVSDMSVCSQSQASDWSDGAVGHIDGFDSATDVVCYSVSYSHGGAPSICHAPSSSSWGAPKPSKKPAPDMGIPEIDSIITPRPAPTPLTALNFVTPRPTPLPTEGDLIIIITPRPTPLPTEGDLVIFTTPRPTPLPTEGSTPTVSVETTGPPTREDRGGVDEVV